MAPVVADSKREIAKGRSLVLEHWSRFKRNWISGVRFFFFLFFKVFAAAAAALVVFMMTALLSMGFGGFTLAAS